MSKAVLYGLVLGLTYATLDKGVFHAEIGYTADQLGDHLDDKNDDGDNYFDEVGEDEIVGDDAMRGEVKTTKKSITIRKKPAVVFGQDGDSDSAEALIGNVDQNKVTV